MSEDHLSPLLHFEGKPCRKCGSTRRYVSNKRCVDCVHDYNPKFYQANSKKVCEIVQKYRQLNLEKCLEQSRKWRQRNPKRSCELRQKWAQANPEKVREIKRISDAKRHAKRARAEGYYTAQEWIKLKEEYNLTCLGCGIHESELLSRPQKTERKLTPDHIVPLSRGGTNWISNIQPLCLPCNKKNWNHYLKTGSQIDFRY